MALVFNGSNQSAYLGFTISKGSGQDTAIFAIVKVDTGSVDEFIANYTGSGAGFKTMGLLRKSTNEAMARYTGVSETTVAESAGLFSGDYKRVLQTWDESTGELTIYLEGETPVTVTNPKAGITMDRFVLGCRYTAANYGSPDNFFTGSVAHFAGWRGTLPSAADITGLMNGTVKPDETTVVPELYRTLVGDTTTGINGLTLNLVNSPTVNSEDPYAISAGPTITGPDSTTEGAATTQTGTLLDTVVTQSLVSGSYSIEQTITGQTTTTLDYVAESGVNLCTPPTPVSGVPLAATISAAGVTPWVVQQKADDGVNPPVTRDITLNPEATHEVIQTMAGVANTTPDQSIFGSTLVTVEDNHQARVPKVVDGVTFTWFADGAFTTDIDKTVTFQYELFSPDSGNWSAIDLTVRGTVILNRTFRVVRARRVIGF